MPMVNMQKLAKRLSGQIGAYLSAPIGEYFAVGSNRITLYPFMAAVFLLECSLYWLVGHGTAFIQNHLAFTTIYSLHKAVLFTLCLCGADMAVKYLRPHWGGYGQRTIGRQWIIWALGLFIGVFLMKVLVNRLIGYYAPEVLYYFTINPEMRPGLAQNAIILLPFWAVGVYCSLQVARVKSQIKRLSLEIGVVPESAAPINDRNRTSGQPQPEGLLQLGNGNGNATIRLADITYVTVEDHYCRITYSSANGLKNQMIRLPLKEMMQKLPSEHFIQTHRSYAVNMSHISHMRKRGREYKLVLHHKQIELPVSRHRLKSLGPQLNPHMNSIQV